MAKLTSAILQKIAPQTKAELRDRFIPYLNEALVRYGIVNELQVAGFLATAAFESQYFQKTKEGKARASHPVWIKYQSRYWHTNFMGRGIFQTTHLKNYRTFGRKMKAKGIITDSEMFVKNPELLEQPKWAVESACEYWETNGLDKYARQGFKGFSALQGRVNKGSAEKVAHDYANRLIVYERARLALPDDFSLTDQLSPVVQPAVSATTPSDTHSDNSNTDDTPITLPTQGQPATSSTDKIVIEKEPTPPGFFEGIKLKVTGWITAIGGIEGAKQYTADAQAFGITGNEFFQKVLIVLVVAFLAWLVFRGVKHIWIMVSRRWLTTSLIAANSTPGPSVTVASTDVLQEYKARGYQVITR